MADQVYFVLNTGAEMPAVGMGCWLGEPGHGDILKGSIVMAFEVGYRHFDTAAFYENEDVVGDGIRASGVPRDEIFVTTKLWNDRHHDVEAAFDESFAKFDVEYIDLFLMHWPQSMKADGIEEDKTTDFVETWKRMEKLFETRPGKVKAIGVSNFSEKTLGVLLKEAKVVPAVNQIETHPYNPDHALVKYCLERGIRVTAYTPLGQAHSPILKDKDIVAVAEEIGNGTTPGQVVLSWNVQRGVGVLPKSSNRQRATQNLTTITLSPKHMERIDSISKDPKRCGRLNDVPYDRVRNTVNGWPYENLGWELGFWKDHA
ncbi:hypothetical protein MSPP1_001497 [Malassezia sp. CBS 17886]|nr:hypothetical protein MSPP1_001497 [Malassezia sp. CBS 17886]